jgi:tRNA A37 threonylcarbamoyladenosine modification protein TsaB|tara:strand:- start:195 stop:803 length:609 start_codon:yes stop_codon:yes gene_type:complete
MIRDFLIINCTGKNDSIALKTDNKFFFKKLQTNLVKNEMLALDILTFFKEKNVVINNKFSLIVNSGPGSFSGIRIALAVAKGIQLVNKTNVYSYNYFLLNAAPYLKKEMKIISIQKTNNFYYYSESCFEDNYTFSIPEKITADCLQKDNSIIVVPQEIANDEIFNVISLKKIKIAEFNLKNIELLIEYNLLENKLIKPLYLS